MTTPSKKLTFVLNDHFSPDDLLSDLIKERDLAAKRNELITCTSSFFRKDVGEQPYCEINISYRQRGHYCPLHCVECGTPCFEFILMFNGMKCMCPDHFLSVLVTQYFKLKQYVKQNDIVKEEVKPGQEMEKQDVIKQIQQEVKKAQEIVQPPQKQDVIKHIKEEVKPAQEMEQHSQKQELEQGTGQQKPTPRTVISNNEPISLVSNHDFEDFLSHVEFIISKPLEPGKSIVCNVWMEEGARKMVVRASSYICSRGNIVCHKCKTFCSSYQLFYITAFGRYNIPLCFSHFSQALRNDFLRVILEQEQVTQQEQPPRVQKQDEPAKQVLSHIQPISTNSIPVDQEEQKHQATQQEAENHKAKILADLQSRAKQLATHPLISKHQLHVYDVILQTIQDTQMNSENNYILLGGGLSLQVSVWLKEAGFFITMADQYRPGEKFLYIAFQIATADVLNLSEKVVVSW